MLRSLSQLFAGPVVDEKGGKQMEGPAAEEASTAPGSDCASDGADASLPSDGASDTSIEESPPAHRFDGEPVRDEDQPGIVSESAEDCSGDAEAPQSSVSHQAASDSMCAAEGGPICIEKAERHMDQIEKNDGIRDPCVELAVASATVDDADVARGSRLRRLTPASQTGDGQAKRRALKRYRQDTSGQWVKGRAGDDGRWLPEPGAATFQTLELAMTYERHKTLLRRNSWANLRGEVAGTRKAVTEEGARTRHHQSREAEETRRSVEEARDALASKVEEGMKLLCAQKREDTLESSSASSRICARKI